MPQVSEVAENIYLIDVEAAFLSEWLSAYLINEEIKVLIEVGSPAAKETLLNGIRQIGVNPGDISYIIVTHIHIDHAGGAGVLVKEMPQAKVLVHPRGGKHLIEPSKLVNSTMQVQGKAVTERYGSVMPLDPERVQLAEDNQVIPLGAKQKLRIWAETIRKTMESYPEETVDRLQDFIRAEAEPVIRKNLMFYEHTLHKFMILSVKGYMEYFKTKETARS